MKTTTRTERTEARPDAIEVGDGPAGLPHLIDVATVAAHLGLTERTIRRRVAHSEIPYFKLGHLVRFDPAEIQAWLGEARVAPHVGNSAEHPNGTRS